MRLCSLSPSAQEGREGGKAKRLDQRSIISRSYVVTLQMGMLGPSNLDLVALSWQVAGRVGVLESEMRDGGVTSDRAMTSKLFGGDIGNLKRTGG